jgi:hypothetical protein
MAMIKCSECSKEMSTKAAACPNCGAKRPRSYVWLWVVLAIPVAFLAFGATVANTPEAKAKSTDRDAISLCWDEQAKKSNSAGGAQFIAGACELMKRNFVEKYGHKP